MTVHLVGAGPGDPGLMTARALELIARAEVIVYDRLIPATALEGARADAELIYAGKEGGGPSVGQDEIERLLLEHGGAGREVVRLKGGDPFVFGRGGEEAETLRAAGIPYTVVPGVSSGVAAPAYAGIPVTHRDDGERVSRSSPATRIRRRPSRRSAGRRWPRFPGRSSSTWACASWRRSARGCSTAAAPPDEPAALVQRGTLPDQRVGHGHAVDDRRRRARGRDPRAGDRRVRCTWRRSAPSWRGAMPAPLAGRTVAVTRARAQASGLAAHAARAGGRGDPGAGHPDAGAARPGVHARALRPRSASPRRTACARCSSG